MINPALVGLRHVSKAAINVEPWKTLCLYAGIIIEEKL